MFRTSAAPLPAPSCALSQHRLRLSDGALTTLHVAGYDRLATRVRVASLGTPRRLVDWCRDEGVPEAVVGGFFVRPDGAPLGEVRIGGRALPTLPFEDGWGDVRACVGVDGDGPRLARRPDFGAAPAGDLLQAGPLLVEGGRVLGDGDPEGFSAGSGQFDSDITAGRYPRAALALTADRILAVVCEGRAEHEAGLTLAELAHALVDLGAQDAINLDGGGSTSLVSDFALVNRPREEHGIELAGGRPVATALVFEADLLR
jgi:hypothetical protein